MELKSAPTANAAREGIDPSSLAAAAPSDKPDIWEILGIPDDVKNTVGYAKEAIGAISTVVSWVGTVQTALKLVGLVAAEPNPFDTLYSRIQKDMKVLLAATIAGATEERMRDVAEQAAVAQAAAIHANEFILLGRPQTTFHLDRLSNADTDSLGVMLTLGKDAYWQRTYDPTPAVVRGRPIRVQDHEFFPSLTWWGEISPAQPSGGLIWDYRHALPAYLQALAARVVVLKARSRNHAEFRLTASDEINGYANFLQSIWNRIRGAIRGHEVRPPQPPDRNKPIVFPPGGGYYQTVGAVEIYSGLRDWTWFDSSRLPVRPRTWGEAWDQYEAERQASFNRLSEALGLDNLLTIIANLRAMLIDQCDPATGANVAASGAAIECIDDQPNQHVGVAGSDGKLHLLWKPDAFSGWQWHRADSPPGYTMSSSPPVMTWFGNEGERRPYVFVSSSKFSGFGYGGVPIRTGALFTYWWSGSQWQWASLGSTNGELMSATPAVTSFIENGVAKMRCYVVAGNALRVNQWTGTKWEWVNLGAPPGAVGGLHGTVTAIRYQWNGRMIDDVYVLAGGRVYEHTWDDAGNRSWNSPPPPPAGVSFTGTPVAVSHQAAGGQPVVYVVLTELGGAGVHTLEWNGGWRWTAHGRPQAGGNLSTVATPLVTTVRGSGQAPVVFVAALTAAGQVMTRIKAASWANWAPISGGNPPAFDALLGSTAYFKSNGKVPSINLFARGRDGNVHTVDFGPLGGSWTNVGR